MSDVRDAAHVYIETVRVIPVRRKLRSGKWRKVPVFKDWQHLATTDPAVVTQWFDLNYPQPDVGVAALLDGYVLIDVDSVAGHGVDGFASLRQLKARTGVSFDHVPGWITQTNGNGFLFRLKPGQVITGRAGALGPGIDTKASGGFAVLPPSRLDLTRPAYQWLNGYRIADAPLLPDELLALLQKRRGKFDDALDAACEAIRTASPAKAHDTIVQVTWDLAAHILAGKLEHDDVLRAVSEAAAERGHDRLEVETALDGALAKQRAAKGSGAAAASVVADAEPWDEPVDGGLVLNKAIATLRRYVLVTDAQQTVSALWALHTHGVDIGFHSPRLNVFSPMKRCGKSTFRRVVGGMVAKPVLGENISAAVIYHIADAHRPTFLFDEVHQLLSHRNHDRPALYSLMCAGYERLGATWRMQGEGAAMTPKQFRVYSPMLLAGIGRIGGSLGDRSIPIQLKRKLKGEATEVFDFDADTAGLVEIGRKFARWTLDNFDAVKSVRLARDSFPAGWDDRQCDCARPLLKIATVLGEQWFETARNALVEVWRSAAGADLDEDDNLSSALLADIRAVFNDLFRYEPQRDEALDHKSTAHTGSARLVELLTDDPLKPWAALGASQKPLTQNRLARMLRPYGITPQMVGPNRVGGYLWRQFADAWRRYT